MLHDSAQSARFGFCFKPNPAILKYVRVLTCRAVRVRIIYSGEAARKTNANANANTDGACWSVCVRVYVCANCQHVADPPSPSPAPFAGENGPTRVVACTV